MGPLTLDDSKFMEPVICANCDRSQSAHAKEKCLFSPTFFKASRCRGCKELLFEWQGVVFFADNHWHHGCFDDEILAP